MPLDPPRGERLWIWQSIYWTCFSKILYPPQRGKQYWCSYISFPGGGQRLIQPKFWNQTMRWQSVSKTNTFQVAKRSKAKQSCDCERRGHARVPGERNSLAPRVVECLLVREGLPDTYINKQVWNYTYYTTINRSPLLKIPGIDSKDHKIGIKNVLTKCYFLLQ